MEIINIKEKFSELTETWFPTQIVTFDGMQVVSTKIQGETQAWFQHKNEDKLVQVIKGELEIHFKTKISTVSEGEIIVIPMGTEYSPKAKEETHILVFEKEELT